MSVIDFQKERLRGLNLGGWFSQIDCIEEKDPAGFPGVLPHMETFIGAGDIERIKSWNFNHVRLPVDFFNFFDPDTLKENTRAFELLDKAAEMILGAGLALILDLHKCPGHDFHLGTTTAQPFFTDASYREAAKRVWSVLAERYGSKPGILLEILNEPVAPDADTWNRVKDELFYHIRAAAPRAPIVVGSNLWNNAEQFRDLTPVDDDNVLYSFHSYQPVIFTHQFAAWIDDPYFREVRNWPGNYPPPATSAQTNLPVESGEWNKERLRKTMEHALEFRSKHGVPVACNEFGVYVQVNRKSQLNWISDFTSLLREADVGFSYWNYKNLDFGVISTNESLHAGLPQYQNPDHLDSELLELLAKA
ncbi:MAG: glycoside hydrolase family 5 protein [Fibrobacter sp.]|jgi:aryl-phospho-beta-D-glucosidase BglC (GH1 family)|nr:glycoside hydrolase family 5 protein [Fibrobacter sp.]